MAAAVSLVAPGAGDATRFGSVLGEPGASEWACLDIRSASARTLASSFSFLILSASCSLILRSSASFAAASFAAASAAEVGRLAESARPVRMAAQPVGALSGRGAAGDPGSSSGVSMPELSPAFEMDAMLLLRPPMPESPFLLGPEEARPSFLTSFFFGPTVSQPSASWWPLAAAGDPGCCELMYSALTPKTNILMNAAVSAGLRSRRNFLLAESSASGLSVRIQFRHDAADREPCTLVGLHLTCAGKGDLESPSPFHASFSMFIWPFEVCVVRDKGRSRVSEIRLA